MEDLALRISDAVIRCGISRTKIYGEIKAGRLRARKCGRVTIILVSELRAWLEAQPGLNPMSAERQ
jgi:hypothetical protein